MAADECIERTARLIEELLDEPALRAEFRAAPAAVLERSGLGELAPAAERTESALETLAVRESRSSLAGVLAAVAAEGIALLELARIAEAHPVAAGAQAVMRAATHRSVRVAGLERRTEHRSAAAPSAKRELRSGGHRVAQREQTTRAVRDAPAIAASDGLAANPQLELPPAAAADLRAGVDPRVAAVLERLTREHRISVSVIRSGHDRFVAGTTRVSNHAVGRAFDIAMVDGRPVSDRNAAAHEVAAALLGLPPELRPSEVGSPWRFSSPEAFTDAAHADHIHVGWDGDPPHDPPSERVPQPAAERPDDAPLRSGAVPRARRRSGAHHVRLIEALTRDEPQPGGGAPTPYAAQIDAAAARHGVDPNLLRGVIRQESNFNAQARSPVGAVGLCQLMPATARGLGVDPTDVEQNLEGGAKLLGRLVARYRGDERLALAAYNAGEGNVERYGGIPPFKETQEYVPRVLAFAEEYRNQSPARAPAESAPGPQRPDAPAVRSGALAVPNKGGLRSGGHAALPAVDGAEHAAPGERMVEIARSQLGQREVMPNDSPRIARYRAAVEVNPVGPWCSYFVSWVARRAGHPLGDHAEGFAGVAQVWSWAQGEGAAHLPGSGYRPRPGDLILYGGNSAHIGIVERVFPDGSIRTIEGNYSDRVDRVIRSASDASGFVSMS